MRINLYAQGRHVVVVDGFPLSGFAEGDFITIKSDGNAAELTKGGDGSAMNISAEQGGELAIHLLPTSPALGYMYGLREAQKTNPRVFSIQVITGVEEIVSASGCAFADLPQFGSGGPTMQPRQFPMKATKIKMDTSAITAIAGAV